ncbi:hypothetical protein RHMOL_Rhmol11G0017600 [Rhododendron molle]|uniref:Uncharacterized protein n=1 Tax=Rhododendron molle TaxID=49168 RepID=A0ACC0LNR8_RHOML|nr:hypothetical protein RHMOL_Rhmol11G0017600 [Rhododendron molle]
MPRYRSKKGEIATNVLGVCTRDLIFVYVLSGWEGSATDSRILQNATKRPEGLIVPHGHYYLVDDGSTNGNGFLASYCVQRYHVNIWRQGHMLVSKEKYFNMKHSAARNVIEKSFGVLKMWFAILRSASYYPIRTETYIVTTCCLLHNLIKREMPKDPIEQEYDTWERDHVNDVPNDDHISTVDSSNELTAGSNDTNEVKVVDAPMKQKCRNWRTEEEDALMKCIVNELVGDKHGELKMASNVVSSTTWRKS